LLSVPKLYNPNDTWSMSPEFVAKQRVGAVVENDIVIGYYEKNPMGIDIKFKLRPPSQQIVKHADSRMLERGAACRTRHKDDLLAIAKSLGISQVDPTVSGICDAIKLELMEREMKERRLAQHGAKKQTKWFYLHFE
jgi:hypothetical protein